MRTRKITMVFSWSLVIFWMLLIFYLSSQTGGESNLLSRTVTDWLIKIFGPYITLDIQTSTLTDVVTVLNNEVRDAGHLLLYFILGVLVINAVIHNGSKLLRRFHISLFVCLIYSISDEIHQIYVPGRGFEMHDILLDSIGAFMGIVLFGSVKAFFIYVSGERLLTKK